MFVANDTDSPHTHARTFTCLLHTWLDVTSKQTLLTPLTLTTLPTGGRKVTGGQYLFKYSIPTVPATWQVSTSDECLSSRTVCGKAAES